MTCFLRAAVRIGRLRGMFGNVHRTCEQTSCTCSLAASINVVGFQPELGNAWKNFGKTQQNVIRQAYVRTDWHRKNFDNISHRKRQRKLPQKVEWRRRVRSEGEDRWARWPIGWSQGGEQQELQQAPNVGTADTAQEEPWGRDEAKKWGSVR